MGEQWKPPVEQTAPVRLDVKVFYHYDQEYVDGIAQRIILREGDEKTAFIDIAVEITNYQKPQDQRIDEGNLLPSHAFLSEPNTFVFLIEEYQAIEFTPTTELDEVAGVITLRFQTAILSLAPSTTREFSLKERTPSASYIIEVHPSRRVFEKALAERKEFDRQDREAAQRTEVFSEALAYAVDHYLDKRIDAAEYASWPEWVRQGLQGKAFELGRSETSSFVMKHEADEERIVFYFNNKRSDGSEYAVDALAFPYRV